MGLSLRRVSISPSSPIVCHLKPASRGTACRKKDHTAYISAWRDAQKLVKEVLVSRSTSASGSQKDNTIDHKTKNTQMAHQQTAASNILNWLKQQPNMTMTERNQNSSKCPSSSQAFAAPSGGHGKSVAVWASSLKGKENESHGSQTQPQRNNTQEKNKSPERKNGHVWKRDLVTNSRKVQSQPQWETKSQISVAEARRCRIEALKRTIASLDVRLDNEADRLRLLGQIDVESAGDGQIQAEDRSKESECLSADIYVANEKELQINLAQCSPAETRRKESDQNSIQSSPEHQDDSNQSPDSTSEWSDLSKIYGHSQLKCHLSMAQSQQLFREEELRARQYSALFRLREEALWEKTQAELALLESRKKHVILEHDAVAEIKKKREEVLKKLGEEQAEIHYWRCVYKCGRQQHWLLPHHERDILDIKKSATRFGQEPQSRKVAEAGSRPRDAVLVQEGRSFSTKPGIIPATRSEDKTPGEQERFLTKAGLRRLLTSDEVWGFGRKKKSVEHITTEQENLQTAGSKDSNDPKLFSVYSHQKQPGCHAITKEKMKTGDVKSLHQHEAAQTDSKPNGYEHEIKKTESPLLKNQHNHQCPSKSTEVYSEENIQNPIEASWRSNKNGQYFTLGQHDKPGCGTSEMVPIISSLSSDIEEELAYDYEDSHEKAGEQSKPNFQETPKAYSASDDMILGCGQAISDYVALNVQNNQQLQTVLLLNNNHEICDESGKTYTAYTETYDTDSVSHISGQQTWQSTTESMMNKPLIPNLSQALSRDVKRAEESPFCDDSFSETEDKSEPFSLHSEALAWSEEEKDILSEGKTEAAMCSLVYDEKFIVVPESCLYDHGSDDKHYEVGLHSALNCKREMAGDSTLSEILSPVDEVLSYGSADLPPSVRGGGGTAPDSNSLPLPPPAFEIITWTSEEDLPAPADFTEDTSINSENVPPLPVDPSLCRRRARSLREGGIYNDEGVTAHMFKALDPVLAPGQNEDEGSEHTGSLPVVENNDTQDPLSSFCIEDKVLVCKSSPGVLKFKGHTAFASGFWAGVTLDTPTGTHNGTFRGVKYFTCEKNCGVLVRAEDISHLCRDNWSDLDTGGVDEDSFLDEDPPNELPYEDFQKGQGNKNGIERNENSQSCPVHVFLVLKQTGQQDTYENATRMIPSELSKCSRSIEKSPLKVDHKLMSSGKGRLHAGSCGAQIEKFTEEVCVAAVKNVQDTRKKHRQRIRSKQDSKPVDADFWKREDFTTNISSIMDQWHQVYPETPPQIQINIHEPRIVYSLVDATVEVHCGHANEGALSACETPSYLADDNSHKGYRQVLFQLASDILHEVCADILGTSGSFQNTQLKSVMSALQRRQISVAFLKAAVKREMKKILNLEHTDQQMVEMLQTLCKYWYAKRDRVDYILIQELHNEERQWVDYSTDQVTVKVRLSEEIFRLLLDDTISVLNHIYIPDIK